MASAGILRWMQMTTGKWDHTSIALDTKSVVHIELLKVPLNPLQSIALVFHYQIRNGGEGQRSEDSKVR